MYIYHNMNKEGLFYKIYEGIQDMCYIWAKEIRSTIKDEGVLIFLLLVPLAYPLLYSWIYNNEVVRDVPTAIVDLSHTQTSREFIREFDAGAETKVAYYCNSLDEAKDLIRKQVVHGILYFPSDFEDNLYRGEQSKVSVYTDMSLMLTYKAIYGQAQAIASHINTQIQISKSITDFTDRDEEITTKPLNFDEVPIFNSTGGYGNAILPGVLILILQQTLLLGIGLSAGTARENNRYQELIPISKHYNGIFRIVFGKSMCYLMIYAVMSAYITLCVPRFFHFTTLVQPWPLFSLMLPFLLAVIFFGMALSCLVRYRENVMLLVVFTSVPLLFMTGISWPLSNMPGYWKSIAMIFPSTWGVRGFLCISSMGGSIEDIQDEIMILWIQAVVYFFATCAVYRYQINHTRKYANEKIMNVRAKAKEAMNRKNS